MIRIIRIYLLKLLLGERKSFAKFFNKFNVNINIKNVFFKFVFFKKKKEKKLHNYFYESKNILNIF